MDLVHKQLGFSISAYATIRGLKVDVHVAKLLTRKAWMLSQKYDYAVATTPDGDNVYHTDILKTVFDKAIDDRLIRVSEYSSSVKNSIAE